MFVDLWDLDLNTPFHFKLDAADQVVLVVRNLRNTLVEFHAIMWDLGFANTYAAALLNEDNLFSTVPPKESFLMWRDEKVTTNIHYFGTSLNACWFMLTIIATEISHVRFQVGFWITGWKEEFSGTVKIIR